MVTIPRWLLRIFLVAMLMGTCLNLVFGLVEITRHAEYTQIIFNNHRDGLLHIIVGLIVFTLLTLLVHWIDPATQTRHHIDYYEKENKRLRDLLKGRWV